MSDDCSASYRRQKQETWSFIIQYRVVGFSVSTVLRTENTEFNFNR